ncbi:MAG: hypothetical protein QXI42_10095 [Thermoproteota archaeon]
MSNVLDSIAKTVTTKGMIATFMEPPGSLLDRIKTCMVNDDFFALAIWGERGSGKSTCALWLLWRAYHYLYNEYLPTVFGKPRIPEDRIWDIVLHHCVFKPSEFLAVLDEYKGGENHWERCPAIYIDDAGLHLSKYYWHEDDKKEFVSLLQVIRFKTKFMMISAPTINDVLAGMRQGFLSGEIWTYKKHDSNRNIIRGNASFILYKDVPDFYNKGKAYTFKLFVENPGYPFRFPKLPPDVEEKYNRKKEEAIMDLRAVREYLNARKMSFLKELFEVLLPTDKAVLSLLHLFKDQYFTVSKMAEELKRKFGKSIPESNVYRALLSLKFKELVIVDERGLWKPTLKGVSVSEYLQSKEASELMESI